MHEVCKAACCCFTGHRPSRFLFKYDESAELCKVIKKALYDLAQKLYVEMGVKRFWCGGALGVDTWAAETIIRMKAQFQDIELCLALPYEGYFSHWNQNEIERTQRIIEQCDICEIVSPYVHPNDPAGIVIPTYKRRNYFMVDRCAFLIAVFAQDKSNAARSGTSQTVNYAAKKYLHCFFIHPDTAEISV